MPSVCIHEEVLDLYVDHQMNVLAVEEPVAAQPHLTAVNAPSPVDVLVTFLNQLDLDSMSAEAIESVFSAALSHVCAISGQFRLILVFDLILSTKVSPDLLHRVHLFFFFG